jgi:hypothetical protein
MRRSLACALVLWLGNTSTALAGETLLASATRLAREAARVQAPSQTTSVAAPHGTFALAQQGQQPTLATSGASKRTKVIVWLAAGVGFAATAYVIDHKVRDDTPSSLGTRKD